MNELFLLNEPTLFCTYHLSSSVYSEVVNDRALLNGPADALGGIIDKLMCQILDK